MGHGERRKRGQGNEIPDGGPARLCVAVGASGAESVGRPALDCALELQQAADSLIEIQSH